MSGTGTPTSTATFTAPAPCRCARCPIARPRSRRRASWSSTERARTRCPGGPATSCTRWGGETTAFSRRGCPDGWPGAIPSTDGTRAHRPLIDVAMRTIDELAKAAEETLALVAAQPAVVEAEVFVAANSALLTRLNYTSHIPCNGDEALRRLGLILGGDVTILRERIAIASTAMPRAQTDETSLITAFVTAMVESQSAKGSGASTGTRFDHFTDEAGAEAAQNAINAIGGERVPSGTYTVIFGRQPVADLLNNIVIPACTASAFYSSSTPFLGKLGKVVASRHLSVYDDGAMPGLMGSKGITCEGLPTGRTDLIKNGVLAGCLSNWYETQRLLRDPALDEKLGARGPAAETALVPRNGFRFGAGGGRQFDSPPGVAASNVVLEGADPVTFEELIRRVGSGLYVGASWSTNPTTGRRAANFTCTSFVASYIFRDGRSAAPPRAN